MITASHTLLNAREVIFNTVFMRTKNIFKVWALKFFARCSVYVMQTFSLSRKNFCYFFFVVNFRNGYQFILVLISAVYFCYVFLDVLQTKLIIWQPSDYSLQRHSKDVCWSKLNQHFLPQTPLNLFVEPKKRPFVCDFR